jgi:peptidoglycan/xylan/chitin deacetylase (PgdA/CDA1 family)
MFDPRCEFGLHGKMVRQDRKFRALSKQGVFAIRYTRTLSVILIVALACVLVPSLASATVSGGSDALGAPGGAAKTWYFAEGTTRAGFDEYVCLLNPGGAVAITEFAYMLGTGQTIARRYDLLPGSRTTIHVNNEVPAGSDVSIKVTSSEPVIAERPMYFNYGGAWDGGHVVVGVNSPAPEWYFAEGTTRDGFDTYICLQNPGKSPALVDLDYFRGDGTTRTRKDIEVKPESRFTIAAQDEELGIGRHNDSSGDFSLRVKTSKDTPVIAERPMYFSYRPYLTGGHDVIGATEPAEDWYFAEGTTRAGFDTYVCIANPDTRDAVVDLNYYCGDGQQVEKKGIEVAHGSRLTVAAHDDNLGIGRHNDAHGDFSLRVHSANAVPIVAERPAYFFYKPWWSGGSDVVGATGPARQWYFAEGCTRQGYDTYLCLSNPGDEAARVDIQYFRGDSQTESKSGIVINPKSRFTVAVHENSLGIGRRDDNGGDVSMKVSSSAPIVAERPMYFAERWRTMDNAAIANAWGWGQRVYGNRSRPQVALTFDCENGGNSGAIMDMLKARGLHATFFMLNEIPSRNPAVVIRMANEGHEVGNHGVTHPQFTKISADRVAWELNTTEASVYNLIGYSTKPFFRFPYGETNNGLIAQVNAMGYMAFYWSVDAQEWRDSNSTEAVINTIVSTSGPGAIILMHDLAKTIAALPAILDGLKARGLTPVTLTELLYPGP